MARRRYEDGNRQDPGGPHHQLCPNFTVLHLLPSNGICPAFCNTLRWRPMARLKGTLHFMTTYDEYRCPESIAIQTISLYQRHILSHLGVSSGMALARSWRHVLPWQPGLASETRSISRILNVCFSSAGDTPWFPRPASLLSLSVFRGISNGGTHNAAPSCTCARLHSATTRVS